MVVMLIMAALLPLLGMVIHVFFHLVSANAIGIINYGRCIILAIQHKMAKHTTNKLLILLTMMRIKLPVVLCCYLIDSHTIRISNVLLS